MRRPSLNTGAIYGSPKIDLGGCVLYLPLWRAELSGSPFQSSGVYGVPTHTCTVTEATWGTYGRTFDGTDDEIVVPASSVLTLPNGFTVVANIKFTDVTVARYFFGIGYGVSAADDTGDMRLTAAGRIETYYNRTAGAYVGRTGTTVLNNTGFYNIVTVHTPNAFPLLYINSVAEGATTGTTGTMASATNWKVNVGWSSYVAPSRGTPMAGITGDIFIYNRVLALSEIKTTYDATKWRYKS